MDSIQVQSRGWYLWTFFLTALPFSDGFAPLATIESGPWRQKGSDSYSTLGAPLWAGPSMEDLAREWTERNRDTNIDSGGTQYRSWPAQSLGTSSAPVVADPSQPAVPVQSGSDTTWTPRGDAFPPANVDATMVDIADAIQSLAQTAVVPDDDEAPTSKKSPANGVKVKAKPPSGTMPKSVTDATAKKAPPKKKEASETPTKVALAAPPKVKSASVAKTRRAPSDTQNSSSGLIQVFAGLVTTGLLVFLLPFVAPSVEQRIEQWLRDSYEVNVKLDKSFPFWKKIESASPYGPISPIKTLESPKKSTDTLKYFPPELFEGKFQQKSSVQQPQPSRLPTTSALPSTLAKPAQEKPPSRAPTSSNPATKDAMKNKKTEDSSNSRPDKAKLSETVPKLGTETANLKTDAPSEKATFETLAPASAPLASEKKVETVDRTAAGTPNPVGGKVETITTTSTIDSSEEKIKTATTVTTDPSGKKVETATPATESSETKVEITTSSTTESSGTKTFITPKMETSATNDETAPAPAAEKVLTLTKDLSSATESDLLSTKKTEQLQSGATAEKNIEGSERAASPDSTKSETKASNTGASQPTSASKESSSMEIPSSTAKQPDVPSPVPTTEATASKETALPEKSLESTESSTTTLLPSTKESKATETKLATEAATVPSVETTKKTETAASSTNADSPTSNAEVSSTKEASAAERLPTASSTAAITALDGDVAAVASVSDSPSSMPAPAAVPETSSGSKSLAAEDKTNMSAVENESLSADSVVADKKKGEMSGKALTEDKGAYAQKDDSISNGAVAATASSQSQTASEQGKKTEEKEAVVVMGQQA